MPLFYLETKYRNDVFIDLLTFVIGFYLDRIYIMFFYRSFDMKFVN